jgi:hypothetical protein
VDYLTLVDISYDGRTLQLRGDQLTLNTIANAFRLVVETVLLVSERGTVAVPQDGLFNDVDEMYAWTVEGDKITTNSASIRHVGSKQSLSTAIQSVKNEKKTTEKWRPIAFPANRTKVTSVSLNASAIPFHNITEPL